MNLPLRTIRAVVARFPAVVPHLSGKARWMAFAWNENLHPWRYKGFGMDWGLFLVYQQGDSAKTYEYFLRELERMITNVYSGQLGGDFIDIMANLISGQLTQAFRQAWQDEGFDGDLPGYLTEPLEDMILGQYEHVDAFYRSIVDARVDGTPIDPLLARAPMWAHQWHVAYALALELIRKQGGGNMVWRKGQTESGCSTCAALDGIVMSVREWEELDVHPRGYPNPLLECEGGGPANNCDCELVPTDRRRSPKAYDTVLNLVSR